MTEFVVAAPIASFDINVVAEDCFEVDVLQRGVAALQETSDRLGLAFDAFDLEFYTGLFKDTLKRNPTSVEVFDMAQSNSEHSRHWFFTGRFVIDGEEQAMSLMKMVKETQTKTKPNNSVIAFHDNSSALEGFPVVRMKPANADRPGPFSMDEERVFHPILTAETHNFPTGIAPFQGATTGR